MIKVYQEDTIVDVVNKISTEQKDEILIEFPFWHPILHNYMSLKILKNKAWNKRITILTNDLISKKIWTQLWINYSIIKDPNFLKEKTSKQDILKHNFTFLEYLIFETKKYIRNFFEYLWKKLWINVVKYYNPYDKIKKSWLIFLIIWMLSSIWMLIFIFYFAVSKTYVEIQPEINIKTKATNIIYEEQDSTDILNNRDLRIPLKKISQTINLDYKYKTTWIDYQTTKRAKAQVTFINELREEQTFKPKTRLLSEDWLLFETDDWVKIPWKHFDKNGNVVFWQTKATITAKIYDEKWKFIWTRWNIKKTVFTIPWLKFSRDKIYAKLDSQATWWDDKIEHIVWEDDLKNSQISLEEMLKKESLKKLKEKIEKDNKENNTKFEILKINNILSYSWMTIQNVENTKIWDKKEEFALKWTITVQTFIYNKTSVLTVLRSIIDESLLDGTDKLMFIDENSLRITLILERIDNPLKIKATTEIDTWISFDFDNNSNFYNQKLKTLILWLSNDEAKEILLNDWKIKSIIIKNTPFFIKKVSSNIDNIIMKIKEN